MNKKILWTIFGIMVTILSAIFYFSYDYVYEKGFHDGADWFKERVLEYNSSEEHTCEDCQVS